MKIYKLIKNEYGEIKNVRLSYTNKPNYIISINFNPSSTLYQEYLAWLAEGNEPLPPDEPEQSEEPNA